MEVTKIIGKICYRTLKDYGLCCETTEDRVFARGHGKKVVISCWTLLPLFYYFRPKRRKKEWCKYQNAPGHYFSFPSSRVTEERERVGRQCSGGQGSATLVADNVPGRRASGEGGVKQRGRRRWPERQHKELSSGRLWWWRWWPDSEVEGKGKGEK